MTVSITAWLAGTDWFGLRLERYWFRATATATSTTAIDRASPAAARTSPRRRFRARTTDAANNRRLMIGRTMARSLRSLVSFWHLDQTLRLEDHEIESLDRGDLVEHGDPPGVQLPLDVQLHLTEVDGHHSVPRAHRSLTRSGQDGHQLFVGGPIGCHPHLVELFGLDRLQREFVGDGLQAGGNRRSQKPGLGRKGVLHPGLDIGPADQILTHLLGDLGLYGRIAGQRSHGLDVGVGIQQLIAGEHGDHREHREDAGQHHQHPRRDALPSSAFALASVRCAVVATVGTVAGGSVGLGLVDGHHATIR